MNFEEQAKRLLSNLQKVISEAEQLRPQALTIDLDRKLGNELCVPIAIKALQNAYSEGKNGDRSSVADVTSVTANIYGCEPCPQCESKFRVVYNDDPDNIHCEDCGWDEPITKRKKL